MLDQFLILVGFGFTAQWVSAALPREDQMCTHAWRTWPNFFDFAGLPPHLKGVQIRWRRFTFLFRCRLELTLVFEARDLNWVILQTVRSGIWRNIRRRKLHLANTMCGNRSSRLRFPLELTLELNTASCHKERFSVTGRWIVFLFGLYNRRNHDFWTL